MNYDLINARCQQMGLSVPQLAEKIGMSRSLYKTMLNKSLRVDTLEKIAQVLDTPVWSFFYSVDELVHKSRVEELNDRCKMYESIINCFLTKDNTCIVSSDRIMKAINSRDKERRNRNESMPNV